MEESAYHGISVRDSALSAKVIVIPVQLNAKYIKAESPRKIEPVSLGM